jgi:hypothetical protein
VHYIQNAIITQGTAAKGYHCGIQDWLAGAEGPYSASILCDAGSSSKAAVDVYQENQCISLLVIPDEEKNNPASRHAKRIGLL